MPSFLGIEYHIWADGVAFLFALAATILCSLQIHHHIYHNHQPQTRRYIIRILLMVIVYSVEAWIGLFIPKLALYLDAIRDTYEALVIYSFYQLLIQPLGGYEQVQLYLENITVNTQEHFWPMNYICKPWTFSSLNVNISNQVLSSDRGTFLNNCSLGKDKCNKKIKNNKK
ncbi:hypothetical protein RFI_32842 [Reticulomyxa filosa]|uniref:Uncharacterized protein n=1 Tax=Reticulomyxa filosa TaxID=46433 RepID=X6LV03_RETFI|nr:hypothetical protein RFI_32842 [Reticulomyxa filosa]|eukprot:ETO04555.1 hypothetical protein RFI_32842 [Reticulomyxa filosa]